MLKAEMVFKRILQVTSKYLKHNMNEFRDDIMLNKNQLHCSQKNSTGNAHSCILE